MFISKFPMSFGGNSHGLLFSTVEERVVKYIVNNFIKPLREYEEKSGNKVLHDFEEETIHKICAIIDVNALESNQNVEMSGLYPTAALMEHNCVANTFHYFGDDLEQYKIIVRAAAGIRKGENITTMYTHALWGTQARREHLRETKYFSCTCKRCEDPTEMGTYLSALRCLGRSVCSWISLEFVFIYYRNHSAFIT